MSDAPSGGYACNRCGQRFTHMGTHDCIGALWKLTKALQERVDRLEARAAERHTEEKT